VGLNAERRPAGLGLKGIEERVRDLRGTVFIQTTAGTGTTVMIRLPLERPAVEAESALARAAG
jgi:signal transduction histidine kinase